MKLSFAYDVTIEHDIEQDEYYHNYFDYTVWNRYLRIFESINVISRIKHVSKEERKNSKKSSGSFVSFQEIPSLSNPIKKFTKRKEAYHLIRKSLERSDALIVRLPSEIGSLAVEVAEEMRIPWAAEVVGHAWDALWNYGNLQGKIYAPVMTLKTKFLVKKSPYVLYVTKEFLQKHYPTNGRSINCSNVEIPVFSEELILDKINEIKDKPADVIKIGLIGSMASKYKGIDVALRALGRIKLAFSFEFRVLGEGSSEEWRRLSVKLGIQDKVSFYQPVPSGEAVFSWLDELDLYIQPSFQEGLPRALIEAMSRGLPAIGSNAGGIPELLSPECIFRAGDDENLAKLMLRMQSNQQWREAEGRKNISVALQYTNQLLNIRRTAFWEEFKEYSKNYKKVL
ncbi:glycosyltransferase [Paenibacillus chitinolyticus]|uniref:glycosyltransferase n=1 Tax=Paenibacillus chitinolyticus TaxID=79263 RepID=UPI003D01D83A